MEVEQEIAFIAENRYFRFYAENAKNDNLLERF